MIRESGRRSRWQRGPDADGVPEAANIRVAIVPREPSVREAHCGGLRGHDSPPLQPFCMLQSWRRGSAPAVNYLTRSSTKTALPQSPTPRSRRTILCARLNEKLAAGSATPRVPARQRLPARRIGCARHSRRIAGGDLRQGERAGADHQSSEPSHAVFQRQHPSWAGRAADSSKPRRLIRRLGVIFHILDQRNSSTPTFVRGSTRLSLVPSLFGGDPLHPGLLLRSRRRVTTAAPCGNSGATWSTTAAACGRRWGGWYVTGRNVGIASLGNVMLNDPSGV